MIVTKSCIVPWRKIVFIGVAALATIFVLFMAQTAISLSLKATSIPTSDYFTFLARYASFVKGDIGLPDLLLQKHADHSHFLVYLVSYFDVVTRSGDLKLLTYGQLISNLLFFVAGVWAIILARINKYMVLVAVVFLASQVFVLYGMELWIFPFQFVLASYRLLLVLGLFIYCSALLNQKAQAWRFFLSILILFVAMLSHGSGVLIPAATLITALLAYHFSGVKMNRLQMSSLGLLWVVMLITYILYPPQTQFTQMLANIRMSDLPGAPRALAFLLGHSLAWGTNYSIQVITGTLGAVLYSFLSIRVLRKSIRLEINLPLVVLGGFYFLACALSVLINLAYAEARGLTTLELDYFLSSRYMWSTSGFWLSVMLMALITIQHVESTRRRNIFAVLTSITLIASSIASIGTRSPGSSIQWETVLIQQSHTEQFLRSGGDTNTLSDDEFSRWFLLPPGMRAYATELLRFQKSNGLGAYSPTPQNLGAIDSTPVNLTDVDWDRGIRRVGTAILLLNTNRNTDTYQVGSVIILASGPRLVAQQVPFGIYLVLELSGAPLNPEIDGYPAIFSKVEH